MRTESQPANGVSRVLAILQSIAEHPDGVTLGELARDFDSPKSSVHRALAALVQSGFARQDSASRYHLGFLFLRLAFGYQAAHQAHQSVTEVLTVLAEDLGETAHYGVLLEADIVYQAKVVPKNPAFQMTSVVGGSNPAYRTGVGKALLMHELLGLSDVEQFIARYGPLVARTPHTLTTADQLHQALAAGREQGYALDLEENEVGLNCIAFPLFLDSPTRPTGAVSISAVTQRIDPQGLRDAAPHIRSVITERLGDVLSPRPTYPEPV